MGKSKPLWYSPCRLCHGRLWQRRCPNPQTSPHTSPPTHDTYRHRTWWSERQTPAGISVTCLSGTCLSWRSAPAWLNPCWPSSFQRWTSSWNTHTSCFKHSWFQNVYIFVLENTLLKYVMGKKALKKKSQVSRSVWSSPVTWHHICAVPHHRRLCFYPQTPAQQQVLTCTLCSCCRSSGCGCRTWSPRRVRPWRKF